MIPISLEQGSLEWLQFRKGKITATMSATIMGLNPFENIKDTWIGFIDPKIREKKDDNAATKHGTQTEPIARKALEIHTNEVFTPICGIHKDYNFIAASFDGVSKDNKIIAEIKCPFTAVSFYRELDSVPEMYYCQIQHQLMVNEEAQFACFFAYHGGKHSLKIVYPNPDFQNIMLERELYFYGLFIKGEEPDFTKFNPTSF